MDLPLLADDSDDSGAAAPATDLDVATLPSLPGAIIETICRPLSLRDRRVQHPPDRTAFVKPPAWLAAALLP